MSETEWRPVKGYEGYYEVSNHGEIKSLDREQYVTDQRGTYVRHDKGKTIALSYHSSGYPQVTLTKKSVGARLYVHRLVAEAFIPNPLHLPLINHKDENKKNNCVDNLEWCTYAYNATYRGAKERQTRSFRGKPLSEKHRQKISDGLNAYYLTHSHACKGKHHRSYYEKSGVCSCVERRESEVEK